MKEEDEVQEMRDRAATKINKPGKHLAGTYEEGLRDALEWVLGDIEEDLL